MHRYFESLALTFCATLRNIGSNEIEAPVFAEASVLLH